MRKPTEEQVREFWEKIADEVGVYAEGRHYHFRFGKEWYRGKQTSFASGIPIIDLNNLFKYAVPKALKRIAFVFHLTINSAHKTLFQWWLDEWLSRGELSDPALALFWALWQIKEGK